MNKQFLDQAVAPNLLDSASDPEIILTLVLANLMSDRLWTFAQKLGPMAMDQKLIDEPERIRKFIDRHYEHVTPVQIFEANGALDLEREADRLGAEAVERAHAAVLKTFEWRAKRGTYSPKASALDRLRKHQLPAYVYSTIDEARAYRRLMGKRKHKPQGLTCCMDEVALFVALMLARPAITAKEFAILGGPSHYSALTWTGETPNWFYGKRSLYTVEDWRVRVRDDYDGDHQLAFEELLKDFDRIVSGSGTFALDKAALSIDRQELASLLQLIDTFFGSRPTQIDVALHQSPTHMKSKQMSQAFAAVEGAGNAKSVRQTLARLATEKDNACALRALYCFRTLQVVDQNIYLRAARRSALLGYKIPEPTSTDEAIHRILDIVGADSIFDDRDRIAMPDETLRFNTGTDRDKALLLHVLLERVHANNKSRRTSIETIMTETDSYVQTPDICFSLQSGSTVGEVTGTPLYRMGTADTED